MPWSLWSRTSYVIYGLEIVFRQSDVIKQLHLLRGTLNVSFNHVKKLKKCIEGRRHCFFPCEIWSVNHGFIERLQFVHLQILHISNFDCQNFSEWGQLYTSPAPFYGRRVKYAINGPPFFECLVAENHRMSKVLCEGARWHVENSYHI